MNFPDLTRTAAALEAYDADPGDAAGRAVGVAYGLDTAAFNNPDVCAELIRPGKQLAAGHQDEPFVRRMVRMWREGRGGER